MRVGGGRLRELIAVVVGIVAGFAFAIYQSIQFIIHQPSGMIGYPPPEPPGPAIPIVIGLLAMLAAWLIAPLFEPPVRKMGDRLRRLPRGQGAAAVLVALLVACAMFQLIVFLGVPVQPCLHSVGNILDGTCDAARPAWLATLDPVARFEVDHWPLFQGAALVLIAFEVAFFVYLLSVRLGDGEGSGSRSLGSGNRHGLALLLGVVVAFAFANQHASLGPFIDLGLGVAAALALEALDYWAKSRYRAA